MKTIIRFCFLSVAFCYAPSTFAATSNLLHTFNDPTVTSTDFFGWSVAVDGNHVLIGARYDNTNGSFVGQAYLFDIAEFTVPEPGTSCLLLGMSLMVNVCRRRKA